MKRYYSLVQNGREAHIYIFGDIVEHIEKEFWGLESDVSGLSLVNEVKDLDVDVINVHINSYGGVVSEGLAIYNTLKNHKAKVRTIVDGFACSAASVVFMAGDERHMNDASMLMIHNAWTRAIGNASELRKVADDLDKITQSSIEAYMARVTIPEEKVKELMDAETWILPNEALEWGFATGIIKASETNKAAASARKALFNLVIKAGQGNQTVVTPEESIRSISEGVRAIEEFKKLAQKMGCILEGDSSAHDPEPTPDPKPEPTSGTEPQASNKPIKFFSAFIGKP